MDTTTESILNWKKYFGQNLVATEKNMIAALSKFKRIELSTLAKFFPQLCFEILSAYNGAVQLKLKELQIALFETLVHLLDITIARNQEYVYLFDNLINQFGNQFPKIGEYLLSLLTSYYSLFERDWNATGRALCRVSILVLKISEKCIKDRSSISSASGTDSEIEKEKLIQNAENNVMNIGLWFGTHVELFRVNPVVVKEHYTLEQGRSDFLINNVQNVSPVITDGFWKRQNNVNSPLLRNGSGVFSEGFWKRQGGRPASLDRRDSDGSIKIQVSVLYN